MKLITMTALAINEKLPAAGKDMLSLILIRLFHSHKSKGTKAMATYRMTFPGTWGPSGRITAVGDTAVRVINTNESHNLYAALMDDSTIPPLTESHGDRIKPAWSAQNTLDVTLKDGEVLNLATGGEPFDGTVITGAA